MKIVSLLVFLLCFAWTSKADQLAYLSKADATKAALYIKKLNKAFLYCGCCEGESPVKIRPEKVEIRYTGVEEFYEVIVTYTPSRSSTPVSVPVDLAYIWAKKRFKTFTIGSVFDLPHDPCKSLPRK